MPAFNKEKLQRAVFILNGIIFLLGSSLYFEDGKNLFGIIQLMAGLFNLIALVKWIKHRFASLIDFFLGILNIVIAFATAIDYFYSDKKYIQYAWLLVTIISIVTFIIKLKKSKPK